MKMFQPFKISSMLVAAALLMPVAVHAVVSSGTNDIVGEATLVIGVAKVIARNGDVRAIDRGMTIRVGDRVETDAGGHVHLRFVDGGRISVRPASRLQVEEYSRSGEQQAQAAIKFRLDEGVVRSITGEWGEAARDRFRLNTPLAAIGVKGTDFVVKSDAERTLATVYTGAIVLTPLAEGCQATLGPCQTGNEKLLSDDMKGQMLSLTRQQSVPQLVAAVDLLAQRMSAPTPEMASRQEANFKTEGNRGSATPEKTVIAEARAAEVAVNQAVALVNSPPPEPPPPLPPQVNQLVWARLAAVAADGDTISRSFAEAVQGNRAATVGSGAYTLYRETAATSANLKVEESSASFRLAGGAAELVRVDRGRDVIEVATVGKGTFEVDFARMTYATQLSITNERIGTSELLSSGAIKTNGFLQPQAGNAFVTGALSLDGKEAGYAFMQAISAGTLQGITLWGR